MNNQGTCHGSRFLSPKISSVETKPMTAALPFNAVRVQGTLINPNDPADVRQVQWSSCYGGWRDDSEGSRTYGRIYTESTMAMIVAQYPTLDVLTLD